MPLELMSSVCYNRAASCAATRLISDQRTAAAGFHLVWVRAAFVWTKVLLRW